MGGRPSGVGRPSPAGAVRPGARTVAAHWDAQVAPRSAPAPGWRPAGVALGGRTSEAHGRGAGDAREWDARLWAASLPRALCWPQGHQAWLLSITHGCGEI